MQYRVSENAGCLTPSGKHLAPGSQVDPSDFSAPRLEQLIRAGFIVEVGDEPKQESAADEAPPAPAKPPTTVPSRWALDPDGLRGMDVDDLNVMILEIDQDVDPFETAEEAIAWLTQDYVPVGG